jgi:hypothetical protein
MTRDCRSKGVTRMIAWLISLVTGRAGTTSWD